MLQGADNDMIARPEQPVDTQVQGIGSVVGKDHLIVDLGPNQLGDRLPAGGH
jgi:hypothetical protein